MMIGTNAINSAAIHINNTKSNINLWNHVDNKRLKFNKIMKVNHLLQ